MNSTILEMKKISKGFPGVQALLDVNFDLYPGEVHALMGENGAGKSTLMKILTGVYVRDRGIITLDGEEVEYKNPKEAQNDGVVIVQQELSMMEDLTVAENIFIGREIMTKRGLIDDQKLIQKSKELFERLGVDIDPTVKVGELTVGNQQMVEIAKAINTDAKIIVFDEPTAALSSNEIEELFVIIRDLKEQGIGVVYISHRMEEIGIITDRVTVLRDGEYVGTVETELTSKEDIIQMMVGRTLLEEPKQKSNVDKNAPIVLEVKNLSAGPMVKNVNFNLKKGEILGFAGLMGAGRTETVRAIFGADPIDTGEIYINGEKVEINNTLDAVELGIGYISEDRKRYGILTEYTIADNIALPSLDKFIKNHLIDEKNIIKEANIAKEKMDIRASSVNQLVKNLSGGNQQKVVIAKWLAKDSEILILDEPTRGIDIGAKTEIYDLMNELVAAGKSIIMISSEMEEILRMSDRIAVLCEGNLTGELLIEEATQEKVLTLATMRNGDENNVE